MGCNATQLLCFSALATALTKSSLGLGNRTPMLRCPATTVEHVNEAVPVPLSIAECAKLQDTTEFLVQQFKNFKNIFHILTCKNDLTYI
jgi:hypothetical protein